MTISREEFAAVTAKYGGPTRLSVAITPERTGASITLRLVSKAPQQGEMPG